MIRRPGRPKLPVRQSATVRVYLTPTQLARLDALRGKASRSAYLARCAGLAPCAPDPERVDPEPKEL